MMKPNLTSFIANNEEKPLKKSCKILNNIIFKDMTNYKVRKQQLALSGCLK